jgi:L-seryl-tRNA(Ser) seleniumtransferase
MSAAGLTRSLRRLPSVDEVLRADGVAGLLRRLPRWAVVEAVRAELEAHRRLWRTTPVADSAASGELRDPASPLASERIAVAAETLARPHLRRVVNATGVVLHTNLGRAPLSTRAIERIGLVASGYSTLEYDPERRGRGLRHRHVEDHLCALTGAEAAVVVNNNAGAVLLALSALAAGRRVVVSRGELVEIGGGFRVPDVMRASGASLVEVGTTNRTRLDDYVAVADAETALFLKVHRSNFAIVGFTEECSVTALAHAARERGLPLLVDLGSGALIALGSLGAAASSGAPAEPTVGELIRQGADLVTFSGDKLLGGPQAGIIVGRHELVARIAQHPLMRALRPDKLTLAALEATLESHREGTAVAEIPALRMLTASLEALALRKDALLASVASGEGASPRLRLGARQRRSAVGGGALPTTELETWLVTLRHDALSPDALAARLLEAEVPIVVRISEGEVWLDVRTIADEEIGLVARTLQAIDGARGVVTEPASVPSDSQRQRQDGRLRS